MNRRALLGGLAVALVVGPAFAQTSGSSPNMPAGNGAMNRTGGQMSQADMQHMQQTMQLGMVALESSRIAMNKAQNADLKRFAGFEVEEQTTLAEVMRSMMDPGATAATGTSATNQASQANMAMQMDAKARDMMQKLQSQQSGAEFDRAYLQAQLQGHQELLQVQEQYLKSNPQNREHMNVAKLAQGRIREHIALLENMQKAIR
jgi:putative membrane protein